MELACSTTLIAAFRDGGPKINGANVCQAGFPAIVAGSLMLCVVCINKLNMCCQSCADILAAIGYSYFESLPIESFREARRLNRLWGLVGKPMRLYARWMFLSANCFLWVCGPMVLFLPECNDHTLAYCLGIFSLLGIYISSGAVLMLVVVITSCCLVARQKIKVRPYLFDPVKPGTGTLLDISVRSVTPRNFRGHFCLQRMMHQLGP